FRQGRIARPCAIYAPAWRRARRQSAEPPVARCRTLSLQLCLLARVGGVPIRNAVRAVHPYSTGSKGTSAAGTQAPPQSRRTCPRRRSHFARDARSAPAL